MFPLLVGNRGRLSRSGTQRPSSAHLDEKLPPDLFPFPLQVSRVPSVSRGRFSGGYEKGFARFGCRSACRAGRRALNDLTLVGSLELRCPSLLGNVVKLGSG